MATQYNTEKEGQEDFFKKLGIKELIDNSDNTDGVYKGTIFEFKLSIRDIHATLSQTIKYLSSMRLRGKSIPKNILLISLNKEKAFLFDSEKFIDQIETIYSGTASRDNKNFKTEEESIDIDYSNIDGLQKLINIVTTEHYTKINIDFFCVAGWADRFYKDNTSATKNDMFAELRNPKQFEKYIYQ